MRSEWGEKPPVLFERVPPAPTSPPHVRLLVCYILSCFVVIIRSPESSLELTFLVLVTPVSSTLVSFSYLPPAPLPLYSH